MACVIIVQNRLMYSLDEFPQFVLAKNQLLPPERYYKGQEIELGIPDDERERTFFRAQYPPTNRDCQKTHYSPSGGRNISIIDLGQQQPSYAGTKQRTTTVARSYNHSRRLEQKGRKSASVERFLHEMEGFRNAQRRTEEDQRTSPTISVQTRSEKEAGPS